MAYVKKYGNKWQYTISCTTEGKTKLIKRSGFHSKEDAQAAATKHGAKVKKQYRKNLGKNKYRKPNIGTRKRLLNDEEYEQLYKELFNNLNNGLGYYILLLNLTTGIRYSEAVALTSEDFDFNNNTINIYKTYHPDGTILPIRSLSGNRIIKIDNIVMSRFKELFKTNKSNNKELIFCYPKNKHKVITKQAIDILLKKVLFNLDIEPVNANDLRRTHASILLTKGLSLQYISERLGHGSTEETKHILHL